MEPIDSDPAVPESLTHKDLAGVWQAARRQLERHGKDRRGTVSMPPLSDAAALRLSSLTGTSINARLDLSVLEKALLAHGVGTDLDQALSLLGAPACRQRQADRDNAARRKAARESAEALVERWPEAWANTWLDWLFQSGQMVREDEDSACSLVRRVRTLLDRWQSNDEEPMARTDLSVTVFGSAHALDDGVLLERCARRALWYALDEQPSYHDSRTVWMTAGILTDRVSAPVLAWHLPLQPDSALGRMSAAADAAHVPIHLTSMALKLHKVHCHRMEPVLLVENPRIVEAAAERQLPRCVIATNGNPSSAVMQLVAALLKEGIDVRHHGDFDTAGIGICRRLAEYGCRPWRMNSEDYGRALATAAKLNLDLPRDDSDCGATPWDPQLQLDMNATALAVHEELVLDELLGLGSW